MREWHASQWRGHDVSRHCSVSSRGPQVLCSTSCCNEGRSLTLPFSHWTLYRAVIETLRLVLRKFRDQGVWGSWVHPGQGQCQWAWAPRQVASVALVPGGRGWPRGLLERHRIGVALLGFSCPSLLVSWRCPRHKGTPVLLSVSPTLGALGPSIVPFPHPGSPLPGIGGLSGGGKNLEVQRGKRLLSDERITWAE